MEIVNDVGGTTCQGNKDLIEQLIRVSLLARSLANMVDQEWVYVAVSQKQRIEDPYGYEDYAGQMIKLAEEIKAANTLEVRGDPPTKRGASRTGDGEN